MATKTAILEAAEEVFAEQGLSAAHMEEIARRAGVAVGTLYNYFDDRERLLGALLETRRESFLQELDAALAANSSLPFAQQLHGFIASLMRHFDSHRNLFAILRHEERAGRGRAGKHCTLQQIRLRASRLMTAGVEAGALRAEEPRTYAAVLVGMVGAMMSERLREEDATLASDPIGTLARLFLEGAARPAQ